MSLATVLVSIFTAHHLQGKRTYHDAHRAKRCATLETQCARGEVADRAAVSMCQAYGYASVQTESISSCSNASEEKSFSVGEEHGSADSSGSAVTAVWWWRGFVLGHGRGLGNWPGRIDKCRPCGCLPRLWVSR